MVKPIPDGYTTVTPYLIIDGVADAIAFYEKAFGAKEVMRLPIPGTDRIAHAEITIGGDHAATRAGAMLSVGRAHPGADDEE